MNHASSLSPRIPPWSIWFVPVRLKVQLCEVVASARFSHLRMHRSLLSFWLILLAGDVELNPGPRNWKYLCGVYSKPVKCNQRGVQCEVCTSWLHTRCIGISNEEYAELQGSVDPWCCNKCLKEALPFHNTSNTDLFSDVPDDSSTINSSLHCTCTIDHQENCRQISPSTVMYTKCRSLLQKFDHLRLLASRNHRNLA